MNSVISSKQSFNLKAKISIVICVFGFFYYLFQEPRVMTVLAFTTVTTISTLSLVEFLIYKLFDYKVKFQLWHFLAIALGICLCFTGFETPSHAIIFQALEDAMTDVLTATGDAVSEDVIAGMFTFFRVIIVLAFITGIILVVSQGFQGNDFRPLLNAMGIGVGIVIAIEVLSNLAIGAT